MFYCIEIESNIALRYFRHCASVTHFVWFFSPYILITFRHFSSFSSFTHFFPAVSSHITLLSPLSWLFLLFPENYPHTNRALDNKCSQPSVRVDNLTTVALNVGILNWKAFDKKCRLLMFDCPEDQWANKADISWPGLKLGIVDIWVSRYGFVIGLFLCCQYHFLREICIFIAQASTLGVCIDDIKIIQLGTVSQSLQ
jgi:hypothetical protein